MLIPGAAIPGEVTGFVVAAAALGGIFAAGWLLLRTSRPKHQRRTPRRRGMGKVPTITASSRPGSSIAWRPSDNGSAPATATLRFKSDDGREYRIGREPSVIGSSSELCTIVLPGEGIAPEHARIWFRQGKFVLHHVGGLSRKTFVSGQEAEWVVLESGDEVTIGAHKLVFDSRRRAAEDEAPAFEPVTRREELVGDDLDRMEAAVRELWAEAVPASETAVGERSGTGKYKVHRRKDELAQRVGGHWTKRGRTVVLER